MYSQRNQDYSGNKVSQCNLNFPANAALETHISDVHTRKTSVKCDICDLKLISAVRTERE